MRYSHNTTIKRLAFCLALFFICTPLFPQQTYFQQEVNYKMEVRLNDLQHSLSAFQQIQYINNSSVSLDVIYMHLWPNGYKNHTTALAKDLLKEKKLDFYYSTPEERGFIDSLDFKVNGKPVKWEYDAQHSDICKLILNEPLRSLDTLMLTTPFFVKIPDAKFSRLGHVGQAYFITQWYPKPAVFDNEGWHTMPYIDQGEYYSEFGSFDVKITLPENYLLAATGDRIDAETEEDFLNKKVGETIDRLDKKDYRESDMAFPPSSTNFKTVRFRQYRVHDFAWFADKRFNVIHDQIELPTSKKVVDTWIFFTNKNFELWKDAITYVNESTLFYSYLLGDYPYNNVTAVDGTIMAGGGMEYPNITVIGDMSNPVDLDVTITHEVGHNWFYGILGSNERDLPFMDEGINSFYEMRYLRAKYPYKKFSDYIGQDSTFKFLGINKIPYWKEKEMTYLMTHRSYIDQALDLPSDNYSSFNYGSIVYGKAPVIFDYLMDYMGEENFDKTMRFYYEQFRFKHPKPKDLIKTLTFYNGSAIDWFSDGLLHSRQKIDYKIKKVKQNSDGSFTLKVKNKNGVSGPINIYGFKENKAVGLIWQSGFEKSKKIEFPPADVDYFKIDGLDRMPDVNRKNNIMKAHGLFKKWKPLQLNFITKYEDPFKTQVNYLPILGANYYNGFMLGMALHNYGFYQKQFDYLLAPMFGFNTKTPVGFAECNYHFGPKQLFQKVTIGARAKTFAYDYFDTKTFNEVLGTNFKPLYLNYYIIAPFIQFDLMRKDGSNDIYQTVSYANTNLLVDSLDSAKFPSFAVAGPKKKFTYSFVNQINYDLRNQRAINPFKLNLNLQHTASMAKLSATLNYRITVSRKNYVDLRFFAGTFLTGKNNERSYYAFRSGGYRGPDDYLFESNFVGRNMNDGFGYSQFTEKDGAMKVPVLFGRSTHWMAGVNLKTPKLFILPVKLFLDVVTCDGRDLLDDKVLWDAGINIVIFKDIVDVYIPLFYSSDIKKTLDLNNVDFSNRIRFTLNIHKLVPKNFIKDTFIK